MPPLLEDRKFNIKKNGMSRRCFVEHNRLIIRNNLHHFIVFKKRGLQGEMDR